MDTFEEKLLEKQIEDTKNAVNNKDSMGYKYGIGLVEGDVQDAKKLATTVQLLKFVLALFVALSYFYFQDWLTEIMVLAVIISLISPFGFFQVFIQKLLEYNIQIVENRQKLNALEANKQFSKIYRNLDKLK